MAGRSGTFVSILCLVLGLFLAMPLTCQPQRSAAPCALTIENGKDLRGYYRSWLEQDVACIITWPEVAVLERLESDLERDQFIEQFWLRRDPTPGTYGNEFKAEVYRRIAFANSKLSEGQGWRTDRGQVYILLGPPDEIDSQPASEADVVSKESWRYDHLEGLGDDVVLEFVEEGQTGRYYLTTPMGGLDPCETVEAWRGQRPRLGALGSKTRVSVGAATPPTTRFPDLAQIVDLMTPASSFPLEVKIRSNPVTEASSLVLIRVVLGEAFTLQPLDNLGRAQVRFFGEVRSPSGRILDIFEGETQPEAAGAGPETRTPGFEESLVLRPGLYTLRLAVRDVNSHKVGTQEVPFKAN